MMLSWLLALGLAAPETCVVRGVTNDWPVTVTGWDAAGAEVSFELLVDVTAEVSIGGDPTRLHAVAPLAFEGHQPFLPLSLAEPLELAKVVTLSSATRLEPLAVVGANVRVRARLARGVTLQPIDVPCASLALTATAGEGATIADSPRVYPTRDWQLEDDVPRFIGLRHAAQRGEVISIFFASEADLPLHLVRKGRSMMQVEARFSNGSTIRGWTPTDGVEGQPMYGLRGTATIGYGQGMSRGAELVAGAGIYAASGATRPWAHAAEDLPVWASGDDGTSEWVQLGVLPGIVFTKDGRERLWVKRADIRRR